MAFTFCFDANIFLELPEIGEDCNYCDDLFNRPEDKKTTERIIEEEVNPIYSDRILILSDMLKFYEVHRGSVRFPTKRVYYGTTMEFKDEVLENIKSYDSDFIQVKLREWIRALKKQMATRKSLVPPPYIPRTRDDVLFYKLTTIPDPDDKQHIVDCSCWANSNSVLWFVTLNGIDFLNDIPSLNRILIDHFHWPIGVSKIEILHARNVP